MEEPESNPLQTGWFIRAILSRPGPTPQSRQSAKLFSSRRNWDSPNPSPAGECDPPPGFGGRGTLAGARGVGTWEIPNSDDRTYTVVLFIYMYFVPYPYQLHLEIWASTWNNNKHRRQSLFCIFLDQPITTLKRKGRVQMSTREILNGDENLRYVYYKKTFFKILNGYRISSCIQK